ncbi:zinc ribbon domain-containing protein, partial [Streptomyces sp. NPDC058757]
MPRYEYRCRTCGDTFELSRPMAESSAPASCPAGHDDTLKLL